MAGSFVCYRLETRSKPHRSSGHREPSWTQLARAAKEDAAASMQHGSRGAKRQSVATARQRQRSACCSSRWGGPLQLAVRGACSGQQPAGPAHAVTAGGVFADVCGSQRPGRDVRDNRCSVDSGHGGLEVVDAHGRERYANVVGRRPPVRRRNRGPRSCDGQLRPPRLRSAACCSAAPRKRAASGAAASSNVDEVVDRLRCVGPRRYVRTNCHHYSTVKHASWNSSFADRPCLDCKAAERTPLQ